MAPDDPDPNDADEAPVLSPDDLEITDDDNVTEIDDGRYVISPSGTAAPPDDPVPDPDPDQPPTDLTEDAVHDWLETRLGSTGARYGFHVTGKFDDGVHHHTLMTNDVVSTFENLLRWYARHAGGDTPVDEVLGILLTEADTAPQFPASTLDALVAAHGLERADSIGALLDALEGSGLRFPP